MAWRNTWGLHATLNVQYRNGHASLSKSRWVSCKNVEIMQRDAITPLQRLALGSAKKFALSNQSPQAPKVAQAESAGPDNSICDDPEIRLVGRRRKEGLRNVPADHGHVDVEVEYLADQIESTPASFVICREGHWGQAN
ncbi:hypothetical protein HBH98_205960 [Parastagonospora nodorum]|nr:hypothetical protein HBH53_197660 [Parastagonospora nodorum]KAH4018309.1 hypothetical protein HBI09_192680 [Parastagonospora nodorum]KAH4046771.1 hypothetical protein HBH49_180350 [Parastagonospora nodorum]KAH4076195.1 hypothetical protein HBH50_001820 [Parastagonospora nodorum]KAH4115317.1 hypothetical protein HBH47_185320 [Parastagonospora nodorum]